jgi:hypothetical protein
MASIDLNKLIQEQILTAAKNQELVQESVTGNQDRYDIANALNEAGIADTVKNIGKWVQGNWDRTAEGAKQAREKIQGPAPAPYAGGGTETGNRGEQADSTLDYAKAHAGRAIEKIKDVAAKGSDTVKELPTWAKDTVQGLPTWAKVGAGVGAGALGSGLAVKKYFASRKAKAGK